MGYYLEKYPAGLANDTDSFLQQRDLLFGIRSENTLNLLVWQLFFRGKEGWCSDGDPFLQCYLRESNDS